MKKTILKFAAIILIAGFTTTAATAQHFYVKVRPSVTVINNRPPAPSPRHVWVEREYAWRNGSYAEVPGYWAAPQQGRTWVPGHWRDSRNGSEWVGGHWVAFRGRGHRW